MRKMARTVLPFKLAATEEPMTAQLGLVLHGEFIQGLGVHRWLEQEMPKPGSKRGYGAIQHVLPFLLMLTGGGRSLEDLRMIHTDQGLRRLLHLEALPSTDAAGDWLRRTGEGAGLAGLDRVNRQIVAQRLRKLEAGSTPWISTPPRSLRRNGMRPGPIKGNVATCPWWATWRRPRS